MTAPSDQQHLDAIKAAVSAALAPLGDRYTAQDLDLLRVADQNRPDDYVEVTVTRRFGGELRAGGSAASTGWRLTTRYVSKTYSSNARGMRTAVRRGIENQAVLIAAGYLTTPIRFESGDDVAPDDGWWSALETWTYSISAI